MLWEKQGTCLASLASLLLDSADDGGGAVDEADVRLQHVDFEQLVRDVATGQRQAKALVLVAAHQLASDERFHHREHRVAVQACDGRKVHRHLGICHLSEHHCLSSTQTLARTVAVGSKVGSRARNVRDRHVVYST